MVRDVNLRGVRRAPAKTRPSASPLGSAIFPERAWQEIARNLKLSGRELQIVRSAFDDTKESAIAANLGVARRTVHTHVERLHHKLAITDRTQLILRVMREYMALTGKSRSKPPSV